MNEENFKQLCDKALLLINGVSEEVFLYEDEKAFVGAWGGCDVAYDDNTVGGVCGQPSGGGQLHCDGKLCGGGYGGAGVIKAQKNSTQNTETDWVLFGCIGGGAVVVLIMIGLMAKKNNTY